MYTYKWAIEKIDGYPEIEGLQNVVGQVSWELEVRDSEDHSIHYIRETTELGPPTTETFTDYLELSAEDILKFVWNVVGKEETENRAKNELDELRAPKENQLTPMGMPWLAECCPDGTGIDKIIPTAV